jgi:hypothetical protein
MGIAFYLAFLGSLFHLYYGFPQASSRVEVPTITESQALSVLRARSVGGRDVGLLTVRRLEPTQSSSRVAQRALEEARSKRLKPYDDGIFVDLMQRGGFIFLEFDKKSDVATKLHLVTVNGAGESSVQSDDVSNLTRSEAAALFDRSAAFSEAFFRSADSQMNKLLREFGGADVATLGIPDGQGYLAVPEAVKKLTTGPEELELISLSSTIRLWTIRRALGEPVYAADPIAAVQQANAELSLVVGKFLVERKQGGETVDHLIDLRSIHTRDELMTRLRWLKNLSLFLEERAPLPLDSEVYRANSSISAVPLELIVEQDSDHIYGATTLPGLISGWKHTASGAFVLTGLSVAE